MTRAAIRRRLAALTALLRPNHSIEARVAALPANDQARFQRWRTARADHYARHPDGEAYALSLAGDDGPWLPPEIRRAVFGALPQMLADITSEEAATIYQRYMENGR